MRVWKPMRLAGLLAVAALAGSLSVPAGAQAAPEAGQKAPTFLARDTNGTTQTLGKYQGKIVLLDFWATWCPPCRAEVPNVVKTYNQYHSKGFEILGISLDRNAGDLAKFTKENGMAWPQVFDQKGQVARKYGVQYIPSMFLIDGTTGKIIGKDLRGEAMTAAVARAVKDRR